MGGLNVTTVALFAWVVTPKKFLGANYAFQFSIPGTSSALELPRLDVSNRSSLGLTDLYVMPVNLGWHTPRADFMTEVAIYLPTGRYQADGDDNKGLGMWTIEPSAATTIYLDKSRRFHLAAMVFYETHSNKNGQDLLVGDAMTIEGGLGGTFFKGTLT